MNERWESLMLGLEELRQEARTIGEISGRTAEVGSVIDAIENAHDMADLAWEVCEGTDWVAEDQ